MDTRMVITYIIVDIFCIILALTMSRHINRDFGNNFQVKSLRNALASYCGFLIFGLIGLISETQFLNPISEVIWLYNMLSLFLLICVSYFWFVFATSRLYDRIPSKKFMIIARIPITIVGLLCISTPFTKYVFSVSREGFYQRGPLFIMIFLATFLYGFIIFVQALYRAFKETEHEKKVLCITIAMFFVFPAIAGILQVYLAGMPILAPSIITAFFLVFINIQSSQIYNDALTGLNNRRRAYHFLEEQLSSIKENKDITVYLMDINSFKQINDLNGHAEGDKALKIVSSCLKTLCTQYPLFVARYGGDEFIMISTVPNKILPETIITSFNNILKQQSEENQLHYPLTISIGYSETTDSIKTADQIIHSADNALYVNKRNYHKETLN